MRNEPPRVTGLSVKKLDLENQKLTEEVAAMKRAAEPDKWWARLGKRAVTVGAVVTVLTTLVGIYLSIDKASNERISATEAGVRARLESGMARLEQPGTLTKLVGISMLSGYLSSSDSDLRRQTLLVFAGFMASNNDVQALTAVLEVLRNLPINGPVTPDEWLQLQSTLVSQNRALARKAKLAKDRASVSEMPDKTLNEELSAIYLGVAIAANARRGAVPTYSEYSKIYCQNCDFSGTTFPGNVHFEGAILDGSVFDNITAVGANFDNAHLEGTRFVEADLHGATFRMFNPTVLRTDGAMFVADRFPWTPYIQLVLQPLPAVPRKLLRMPNFSCADLTGASFAGHALFPAEISAYRAYELATTNPPKWQEDADDSYADNARKYGGSFHFSALAVTPPRFYRADLSGVDLRTPNFFAVSKIDNTDTLDTRGHRRVGDFHLSMGSPDGRLFTDTPKGEPWRQARDNLHASFHEAKWEGALVGDSLKKFLGSKPDDGKFFKSAFSQGYEEGSDPDAQCKPRRGKP